MATLMEQLVNKGQEFGYKTATQLFSAAGVNSNAQLACNKNGTLSNTNKQRLARVLKISVGDINSMMAAALRDKVKAEKKLIEEEYADEQPVNADEQPVSADEQPEVTPVETYATADEPAEEFYQSYSEILQKRAQEALRTEYAKLLQEKMLDTAKADLRQVCENYLETDSLDFIESVHKISGEIIKMKEGEE